MKNTTPRPARSAEDIVEEIRDLLVELTNKSVSHFAIAYDTETLAASGVVSETGFLTSPMPMWQARGLMHEGLDLADGAEVARHEDDQ